MAILPLSFLELGSVSGSNSIGFFNQGGCLEKPDSSIFREGIDLAIELKTLYNYVGYTFLLD